jgi:ATP-dependent RNA helicase DDX1
LSHRIGGVYVLQGNLDLGTDRYGYGFGGTGKKSNNRQFDDYGTAYGLNDVIGCALDLDNRIISFYKNGVELGKAFDINPEFRNKALFPAVALKVQLYIILACHSNC